LLLSDTDEELLDLVTLETAWYIVCGDFHRRYGGARALARRQVGHRDPRLITVRCKVPGGEPPDADMLEADALANDCYRNLESTREPEWEFVATDRGLARIGHRRG
jgi:hypothetical protein